MKNIYKNKKKDSTWLATLAMAVMLVFGGTSCDNLLNVTDPDIVTPESLNSEAGIETLKAGSLGDLAVAMSGSSAGHGATAGLIVMSGLMSDEFDYSGTFPTRREGDTRLVQDTNGTLNRIFGNLHRARAAAEATIDLAVSFGGVSEIESEMASIAGFVYVVFAETHCAGIPFSKATAEGELILGSPLATDDMYGVAITWFDKAMASTTSGTDLYNLASVGKGRALLGTGDISGAAAAVASVPTSFEYNIEHSDNSRRQENGIYTMTTTRRQYSIADVKGINGIDYRTRGANGDPRVQWNGGTDFGQDDITLYYNQLKYTSPSAPVVLASGIEARLIEAEAAANAGQNPAVATIHDDLRATIGLGPVDLTGMNSVQLVDYHFTERALWLYSTGHRQGDLRRLVKYYNRPIDQVFPWGDYFKGGQYGSTVTFPVPQSEANNPNYVGCLNENP
jgi:hypothetical protein